VTTIKKGIYNIYKHAHADVFMSIIQTVCDHILRNNEGTFHKWHPRPFYVKTWIQNYKVTIGTLYLLFM